MPKAQHDLVYCPSGCDCGVYGLSGFRHTQHLGFGWDLVFDSGSDSVA